jgi:hypothetical protein
MGTPGADGEHVPLPGTSPRRSVPTGTGLRAGAPLLAPALVLGALLLGGGLFQSASGLRASRAQTQPAAAVSARTDVDSAAEPQEAPDQTPAGVASAGRTGADAFPEPPVAEASSQQADGPTGTVDAVKPLGLAGKTGGFSQWRNDHKETRVVSLAAKCPNGRGIMMPAVGHAASGAGYRTSGAGYRSSGAGYGSSGAGYGSSGAGYGSSGAGYGSSGAGYGSSGAGYGSSGAGYAASGVAGYGSSGAGYGSSGAGYGSSGAGYALSGSESDCHCGR